MTDKITPNSTDELIAALADGELDLCNNPQALADLARDPKCVRKLADQQRLKEAVSSAMCGSEMCCPDSLRQTLMTLGGETTVVSPAASPVRAATPAPRQNPILAKIGRWAPAAVAAILLLAAGIVFNQASQYNNAAATPASVLPVSRIHAFASRHGDCAKQPEILRDHQRFGDPASVKLLPGKLSDYFARSADGLNLDLSKIGYDYQMTGACSLPGSGGVHLIYRNHNDPSKAMSLWLRPDDGRVAIEPGRLYVEAGENLDHPVILWRDNGMLFYLMGDSLEDAHKAIDELRNRA